MSDQETVWREEDLADPHAARDKAGRVRSMFAAIADSYDLNNRLHSLGRDQAWRRAAVRMAGVKSGDVVLDVACGTGDLAMAFAVGGAGRVLGVDFTVPMLSRAEAKQNGQAKRVVYAAGDAMRLPVRDASVDIVSIAFGIRNVTDPGRAIGEFRRVLRPGGRLVILEFSQPTSRLMRRLYGMYFNHVMPRTAGLIARDRSGAYRYLPRSVNTFIDREKLMGMMVEAGFEGVGVKPLTFGIAVCYRGEVAGG